MLRSLSIILIGFQTTNTTTRVFNVVQKFRTKNAFRLPANGYSKYTTLISLIPTNQSFGHPHESIISRRRGRKMFALKSYWPGLFKQSAQWIWYLFGYIYPHKSPTSELETENIFIWHKNNRRFNFDNNQTPVSSLFSMEIVFALTYLSTYSSTWSGEKMSKKHFH